MPDQSQWPDADADKVAEMAAAEDAFARLIEALRQLETELENIPARAAPGYLSKRQGAAEALQRHAQATITEFAFVDGQGVSQPDPALLTAFYTDPMHCVAARYCWALLGGDRTSLQGIIAATRLEYDALVTRQGSKMPAARGWKNLGALLAAERKHVDRADRLGYRLAVLRRLSIVHRHVGGAPAAADTLETETVQALEAAEEAADTLRQIRWAKLAKRRGDR